MPAASYRLVEQIDGRGVFSFCMCPGGFIVPAATAPGELVINGMSLAGRDAPFANSGVVVEVRLEDIDGALEKGPLAAMDFQKKLEQRAFQAGGSGTAGSGPAHDGFCSRQAVARSCPNPRINPALFPRRCMNCFRKASAGGCRRLFRLLTEK